MYKDSVQLWCTCVRGFSQLLRTNPNTFLSLASIHLSQTSRFIPLIKCSHAFSQRCSCYGVTNMLLTVSWRSSSRCFFILTKTEFFSPPAFCCPSPNLGYWVLNYLSTNTHTHSVCDLQTSRAAAGCICFLFQASAALMESVNQRIYTTCHMWTCTLTLFQVGNI